MKATAIFAACLSLLFAQTPAGPVLKPEVSSLAYFQGAWSCEGHFFSADRKISADMAFHPDVEGAWLVARHDDRPPNVFHALGLWGFDKTANHFVAVITDNFGGVRMFTSPGWEADRLTWTTETQSATGKTAQHFLIDKKSPREFAMTYETNRADGPWKPVDTITCTQK